jgi:hypothetical protein
MVTASRQESPALRLIACAGQLTGINQFWVPSFFDQLYLSFQPHPQTAHLSRTPRSYIIKPDE